MDNRPIGVFDSGLGGLTVWRELQRGLPNESLYYFGDGINCPYGDKSKDEVLQYVVNAVEELIGHNIKMLVVACNAATAFSIDYLRANYSIPIVGMEPAVKPAVLNSKSGVVGVVATAATLNGSFFSATYDKYAEKATIIPSVGDGFVELVESNMEESQEALSRVEQVILPLIDQGVDEIVLGCTHYPFLIKAIKEVIGDRDIKIIDPASAIKCRVEQLLNDYNISASATNMAEYKFFTASNEKYLLKLKRKADFAKY